MKHYMKNPLNIIVIVVLLTSNLACSQDKNVQSENVIYLSDVEENLVFENVIEISDDNIVTDGNNYLFDVAIPKTNREPVVFVGGIIPLELLPTMYPEYAKLTVIVPNWTYYDEIANIGKSSNEIICAEPLESSIVYTFNREKGALQKDSLVIMGGFPKIKFNKNNQLKTTEKVIYYKEILGSICCPRDPQWDNQPSPEEFLKAFEKENNVTTGKVYNLYQGDEGEADYNYTLNGLSNKIKLKFVTERDFYRLLNKKNKDRLPPKIYTPMIIEIKERTDK